MPDTTPAHPSDPDRNLLFGVLALQVDLIDAAQFAEACTAWTARKHVPLAEQLVERGWLTPEDRADVERLLDRKLRKHGDARAGLDAVADAEVWHTLTGITDADVRQSLAGLRPTATPVATATVDQAAEGRDRYVLTGLHATGGIGRVWLARDVRLGRDVALKELLPEQAGDAGARGRFLKEAQVTGQLEHPGIVPVYELGHGPGGGPPFYTMRFVRGHTLSEAARAFHHHRLAGREEPLELLALLNAFVVVCNTVAYAHSRGVIHRDLKGQNVVLGDFGEVILLDWGLAKLVGRPEAEAEAAPVVLDGTGADHTVQGTALGTPAYMAPEQAAGRLDRIDRHTDVYGLGAILYEVLTGQPPFTGGDTQAVLRQVRDERPVPPRQRWPEVPPALESVCLRALAKDPAARHAAAADLAHAVQGWQEGERRKAEEALRASERHFRELFEHSPDAVFVEAADGTILEANAAACRLHGCGPAELVGKNVRDLVPPERQATAMATFARLARGELGQAEGYSWTHDGRAVPVEIRAGRIERGGRPAVLIHIRDVTERSQAQEALRESEERYRSMLAAVQEGVLLLEADGTVRACNARAERILGLSADQLKGRTLLDPRWQAVHEDGSPFPGEEHPAMVTLRTGRPCANVVLGVRRPDGEPTWLVVNAQPLYRADGVTRCGVVASFEDVTARKRAEETLRQAEAELARLRRRLGESTAGNASAEQTDLPA